jgi:hypothetical protein
MAHYPPERYFMHMQYYMHYCMSLSFVSLGRLESHEIKRVEQMG